MKNNKGMTLLESLMAISILSIAGLIIMTGISTVIRVMSDANTIKNQSDMILSKAENTDESLDSLIKGTDIEVPEAVISNTFGNTVKVKYQVTNLEMIKEGKVSLKVIKSSNINK